MAPPLKHNRPDLAQALITQGVKVQTAQELNERLQLVEVVSDLTNVVPRIPSPMQVAGGTVVGVPANWTAMVLECKSAGLWVKSVYGVLGTYSIDGPELPAAYTLGVDLPQRGFGGPRTATGVAENTLKAATRSAAPPLIPLTALGGVTQFSPPGLYVPQGQVFIIASGTVGQTMIASVTWEEIPTPSG